jgi:biotin transport system substrate-specific component
MTMPVVGAVAVPAPTIADRLAGSGPLPRNAILVALGAVVIALSAAVSIRLPDNPVPITGQTFGVLLTAGALGGRRGAVAPCLYVAIGVVGLPAFAEGPRRSRRHRLGRRRTADSRRDGWLSDRVHRCSGDRRTARGAAMGPPGSEVGRGDARRKRRDLCGRSALARRATGFSAAETVPKGLAPFVFGDLVKLGLAGLALPAAWWLVGRRP